ncbi:MAG: ftsL [Paenibacillaceae bacterium]|jgi:cell division protein FtsL|nr:ftsL [Paenibacillaceae bacterium]
MAAYIRGNLAVEERQTSPERVKIKETRRVVYRTSRLPTQEKLLYLFTVLLCALVAGVVIWRYAQIYQMNTRIHDVEREISRLEADNNALKEKLSRMIDPTQYMDEAAKKGLVRIPEADFVRVPGEVKTQPGGPVAVKP